MQVATKYFPSINAIKEAAKKLHGVATVTPCSYNTQYSKKYNASIYFKREDLQQVRSYKIRGAFNKIASLTNQEKANGIICASAGNHAQGVALSCKLLKIKGTIYMPIPTPNQKIEQVKMFGEDFVDIILEGDTFDDAYIAATSVGLAKNKIFIHPFNDEKVIEGQATIALEILAQAKHPVDYLFLPVGGGGLAAGVSSIFKKMSPNTKIIGVEPMGAPSMKTALEHGKVIALNNIEKFVDGAAVKEVGTKTFSICKETLNDVVTMPEGNVCQTILELYNKEAIVVEPAGALSITALDSYKNKIEGKHVVCIISGSNNDITRTAEIKERALLQANLKHYFIVTFPQRAGALKQFVADILGPNDDITHFEYTKKTSRENGTAVVGIELASPDDLTSLIVRMKQHNFYGDYLNNKPELFQFLI
jgi:threonine dehydratase